MAKKINGIEVPEICSGYFEYKMSKTMADAIIRSTKEKKNNSALFTFDKPVHCDIINNKVIIQIQVIIRHGVNVDEICSLIQQEVADALTTMVETVPFSIKIKVVGIE